MPCLGRRKRREKGAKAGGNLRRVNENHLRLTKYIDDKRRRFVDCDANSTQFGANENSANRVASTNPPRTIKMLLLGAGESGKSTIAKQMKIMHTAGFKDSEKMKFIPIIYSNVLTSLLAVITKVRELDEIVGCQDDFEVVNVFVQEYEKTQSIVKGVPKLPGNVCLAIKNILKDPMIQKCVNNGQRYGFTDSTQYFFQNFNRISLPEYVPNADDIIRSRVKTIGVYEINFVYKSFRFVLTDVGGQKSERKKWIYCFEDVQIVLYVASLNDYCALMLEDSQTNRLVDSLQLFETLLRNSTFRSTTFVLILNKSDLFRQSIAIRPLSTVFPDYKGPNEYQASANYILNRFLALNKDENRYIYHHITCATDSSQVEFVFRSVADSLIREELDMIY